MKKDIAKTIKLVTIPLLLFNIIGIVSFIYFLFQDWKIALGFLIAVLLIIFTYSIYMFILTIIAMLPSLLLDKFEDNKVVTTILVVISCLLNFVIHAAYSLFMFNQGLNIFAAQEIKSFWYYIFGLVLLYFISISGVESLYYKEKNNITNAIFIVCHKFSFLVLTVVFMFNPIGLISEIIILLCFGALPFVLCSLMDYIKGMNNEK